METMINQNNHVNASAVPSTQQVHSRPTAVTALSGTGYTLIKSKQKTGVYICNCYRIFLDLSVWNQDDPM